MFINWRFYSKPLRAPNDGNESGGGTPPADQETPPTDGKGGNEEKKNPETVPYSRFAEVNSQKKDLEAQLAVSKQKETEENEKKRKDEEEKAKENGEYQKLIDQKDQELANYKSKQEAWNKREEALTAKNTSRIEALKTKLGENWSTAESLITGKTDPFELEEALNALETLHWDAKPSSKGGGDIPDGNGNGRLAELKSTLEKGGRLSSWEQREYFKLLNELEQK